MAAGEPISVGVKSKLTVLATANGYGLEVGRMPDEPDKICAIFDTPGLSPNPKFLLDYPSIQITVRGPVSGYLATYTFARKVKDTLLGLMSQDVNGERWVSVLMEGDLGFIGVDESQRPLFSMNLSMIVEPATSIESNRVAL